MNKASIKKLVGDHPITNLKQKNTQVKFRPDHVLFFCNGEVLQGAFAVAVPRAPSQIKAGQSPKGPGACPPSLTGPSWNFQNTVSDSATEPPMQNRKWEGNGKRSDDRRFLAFTERRGKFAKDGVSAD